MATSIVILTLAFAAVGLFVYSLAPLIYGQAIVFTQKREKKLSGKMDRILSKDDAKKVSRFLILAPVVFAVLLYFVFPKGAQLYGVIVGFILGFIVPSVYTKMLAARTRKKYNNQLIDALMIMSSSFRGGLSLVQALEAVVEEMPNPISHEFATVLGENKMGVSLEEALSHLYQRMPSPAMQQMITSILLARETGGNLPVVFARIVTNIREVKKIQSNIDTLTLQGKLQGVIMTFLPLAFAGVQYSTAPQYLDILLKTPIGQKILIYCVISESIGAFLIWKFSQIKEF